RKQQMLGFGPTGATAPYRPTTPDRPFWSLAAPAVSANPAMNFAGDPQYQTLNAQGQTVDLAGIASTILPYPHTDPNTKTTSTIGTFAPLKNTGATANVLPYQSIDYPQYPPPAGQPPPQLFQSTPTVPPYITNELLSKLSGHVTPRSNNFAV